MVSGSGAALVLLRSIVYLALGPCHILYIYMHLYDHIIYIYIYIHKRCIYTNICICILIGNPRAEGPLAQRL